MSGSKVKAIFFDFGYTFSAGLSEQGKKEIDGLLKPHGFDRISFLPYWRSFYSLRSSGKIKNDEEMAVWVSRVLQKDIPLEKIIEANIRFQIISEENIKIVKELKKDYKVGLLTNYVKEWLEKILENYKIRDLFEPIIVSSTVGARKPDAIIYHEALKKIGTAPKETAFVSDEISEDLVGAKGCGMKTVWLAGDFDDEWNKRDRELLSVFTPDAIIKDLKDVPVAVLKIMIPASGKYPVIF